MNAQALGERNKKLKILPWSEIGFEGYSYSAILSDKLINERPDVARRFVRAIRAAGKAAIEDPKGVAQSIKALYPDVDEALTEQLFVAALGLMDNDITKAEGFGTIDKKRLRNTWEWVANLRIMILIASIPRASSHQCLSCNELRKTHSAAVALLLLRSKCAEVPIKF